MKTLHNPYLATLLLSMTAKAALADRLADPTRPADVRPATNGEVLLGVRVEAILQSGERRLAIVNGKVVRPGDRIGAVQILEVTADSVRYSRTGESHVAHLDGRTMQVRHNIVQPEGES